MALLAAVSLTAFCINRNAAEVKVVYPPGKPVLNGSDFTVRVGSGQLSIGKTSLAEAKKLLPQGKDLGMSTVYASSSPDCILTFNKDQTMLKKLHLQSSELSTARGIRVGDTFTKVTAVYGSNYIYSGKTLNADDFSAIYQLDDSHGIVFQIVDQRVETIVLHEDIVSETRLKQ